MSRRVIIKMIFFVSFADGQDEGGSGQERGQAESPEGSEAAETVRVAIGQPSKSGLDLNLLI